MQLVRVKAGTPTNFCGGMRENLPAGLWKTVLFITHHLVRPWATGRVRLIASSTLLSSSALLVSDSTTKQPAALVRVHGCLWLGHTMLIVFVSVADYSYVCDHTFENGGWLQVRFKTFAGSPSWHIARDGLRGVDVYGYPGTPSGEYSLFYNHILRPETEMLFRVGPSMTLSL
jgi:hypothetical protein